MSNNTNQKLDKEIEEGLRRVRPVKPKKEAKKERTKMEKVTMVTTWTMVIVLLGSTIYAAISALGFG